MEPIFKKRTLIIISAVIASTIVLVIIISYATVSHDDCFINVKEDFSDFHPLLLEHLSFTFSLPNNDGNIIFTGNEKKRLACPGINNRFEIEDTNLVIISCSFEKTFLVNDNFYSFEELRCINYSQPTSRISQKKCGTKFTEIEIGFNVTGKFVPVLTTCFDDAKKDSLYSMHYLSHKINNTQKTYRPKYFIQDIYYQNYQLEEIYSIKNQKDVFNKILGPSGDKYLTKNSISKGHLAPNADFIYGAQKNATFFYVNVAPQWTNFNNKNWNLLEQSCRNFAISNGKDLIVYTGTYGNAAILKKNLYLIADNTLIIPEVYWKILYHPISLSGIVFIGHNNPHDKNVTKLCNDICESIKWLSWKPQNIDEGFSYCCKYEDFKKIVDYLPDIKINKLLL